MLVELIPNNKNNDAANYFVKLAYLSAVLRSRIKQYSILQARDFRLLDVTCLKP